MIEKSLESIDQDLAARISRRAAGSTSPMRRGAKAPALVRHEPQSDVPAITDVSSRNRLLALLDGAGWIEMFLAIQFLWGAAFFVPGMQAFRGYVRALPYLSSLAMLVIYGVRRSHRRLPHGGGLVVMALLLMVLNLLHPTSQFSAGIAQCVFQLSIAAPLFWAFKTVRTARLLERLFILVFLMNAFSAALGVLQVYFPDQFMPVEFSQLALQNNQYYLDGLTYLGNDRTILRPPGLTDQPGAASTAGALAAVIGLGLLLRARKPIQIVALVAFVTVGLAVIYLTQVRSVLLATLGAALVLALVAFRRGRAAVGGLILVAGGAIVVASFLWASSLGGAAVNDRFLELGGSGALSAFQEGRGGFLSQTVGELLDLYPLGAGVGRWGMINTYFANPADLQSSRIYVEIQLTGWLLDGGLPLWLLYGGAILLSLWSSFKVTASPDGQLAAMAMTAMGVQVFVAAMMMAAPVFNTQLGVLFWAVSGMLYGATENREYYAPVEAA